MRFVFRIFVSFFVAFCLTLSGSALNVPLSDQAVREAYFLGQRHDASFLVDYIKFPPPPKTGPRINSVTFLTPFAQLAQLSDRRTGNYSAQQAALDHRGQEEVVHIVVEILLTPTYAAFLAPEPNSRSSPPPALIPRPHDFWREFQVQIFDGDQPITPSDFHGRASSRCGRRGPCSMIGAILEFSVPAGAFSSGSASIQVTPPEGEPASVQFNLTHLR
jgi:hypothetical protein